MATRSVLAALRRRGLLAGHTSDSIESIVGDWAGRGLAHPCSAYCGFDPTARSLHIGNLVQLLGLWRLGAAGFRPVALVGTATGRIGDPSGKSEERVLLGLEELDANAAGIRRCVEQVLAGAAAMDGATGAASPEPLITENATFYSSMNALDYIRDVGRQFRVSSMLGKESVRARLESAQGMSFTEFAYQTLQAWDFLQLYDRHGCVLQVGGSDQWGNITAGVDLIRRARGAEAYGLTLPLLTTADGRKLGKSEGNAIWLDSALTSHYALYQHFLQAADADVSLLLHALTLLPDEEAAAVAAAHAADPDRRLGQRTVAAHVVELVRGREALATARAVTSLLFPGGEDEGGAAEGGGGNSGAEADVARELVAVGRGGHLPAMGVPSTQAAAELRVVDALVGTGLAGSKGEAKRLVKGGGVSVGGARVGEPGEAVGAAGVLAGKCAVLRVGKAKVGLVYVAEE